MHVQSKNFCTLNFTSKECWQLAILFSFGLVQPPRTSCDIFTLASWVAFSKKNQNYLVSSIALPSSKRFPCTQCSTCRKVCILNMVSAAFSVKIWQGSSLSPFSIFFYFPFYLLQMNICNKPPNKTAPEKTSETTFEVQSQHARRNGWSWPPHPFQFVAWLLFFFFALVGFGILVPLLPIRWVPAGYIVSFMSY